MSFQAAEVRRSAPEIFFWASFHDKVIIFLLHVHPWGLALGCLLAARHRSWEHQTAVDPPHERQALLEEA